MSFAEAQDEWKLQPTWSCARGLKKYSRLSWSGLLPTVGELSPQHPLFQRPTVLGDTPQDPDTASRPALVGTGVQVYVCRQSHTDFKENSALGQLTGMASKTWSRGPHSHTEACWSKSPG